MAMACPRCREKKTRVRETRGAKRTRLCPACGEVFITQEVFEEDLEGLKLWRDRYAHLVRAMEVLAAAVAPQPPRVE